MDEGHNTPYFVHIGGEKLYEDFKEIYWWRIMKHEVAEFVSKYLTYQNVKIDHKRPMGNVESLEVPGWKWDFISMDFVTALPKTKNSNDTIWVIMNRLMKYVLFVPIKEKWKKKQLAKTYIKHVVRLHGVPTDIISDRDSRFLSKFL